MRVSVLGFAAAAAATMAFGPCDPTGLKPPKDLAGMWGGENAALIADDSSAHIHIGCTYGDVHQQIIPDRDGRFDVPGDQNITARWIQGLARVDGLTSLWVPSANKPGGPHQDVTFTSTATLTPAAQSTGRVDQYIGGAR